MREKVKSALSDLKLYWRTPPRGRYMSFKEIASLSVGGIGEKFIVYCISQMIIAVGNTLIGNTIGIDPSALYVIYIISVLSGFPLTALRAKMIDNTRSMKGKYRPYIITMGIPTVILGAGFIWMPYESMSLFSKCAVVLLFNIGFQFFYNFYTDAYDSLINVLSPNSIERSDVLSIKSVVENFSPSIASIFLPIVARIITGQDTLYDLKIYRVLFPPMLAVGFVISLLVYVNTEEKIVQAKTHVIQMKFTDAFRAIARNKYFWIISLAGWLGFLEGSFNSILGWMYNYQHACSAAQYSVIIAIAGNASFWPNLIAPFFIRKYGKKRILVFTNVLNIGFIVMMLPIVRMTGSAHIIWLLLACTFINQFITSLGHLLTPSVNADIRDYQQYITGERIDGMFAAVGLIGNVITLATGFVLPALYESSGLNRDVAISLGYDGSNVYDVLYNQQYFVKISSVLVMASVAGAVLNVIPFFFYDLSETRQKAMVRVLKIRALFEDYSNNVLSDESLVEAVDIIREAKEYSQKETADIALLPEKDKKARKKAREENDKIEIAKIVMRELNQYETEFGIEKLDRAKAIVDSGLNGYLDSFTVTKAEAKALPKATEFQKERRRDALIQISNIKAARKAMKKYYPDGVTVFDSSIFETLFKAEDDANNELFATANALKTARENGDKASVNALKSKMKEIQLKQAKIKGEIKKATNENSLYYRAAKPFIDAKRIISQCENYKHFEEIEKLYDNAKASVEEKERKRLASAK
ncbi:MAG: MFS transporter [Clostridiales bacterium]|nr:MFS transporter [Clostridiales bacterium]